MRTLVLIDSVSRAGGGLLDAERCLHQGLVKQGVGSDVFALHDPWTTSDLPGWMPLVPEVFHHRGLTALGSSPALHRVVLSRSADLIYRAGLWRMSSKYAHEWSKKHRKPEIIVPHGMLNPRAIRISRWKKRLAYLLFEKSHLRDAACIRALCISEAEAIRSYGLRNPICIVPNGINLPRERKYSKKGNDLGQILLFLGRIHPIKGLVNALRAWAKIRNQEAGDRKQEEWQFVIAGWDQSGHEVELKCLCDEIGLDYTETEVSEFLVETSTAETPASVIFVGPAFGQEKEKLLRRASAFILPSFSEGLPMSLLEAWSYSLPVLMTDHCNIPEGFAADAAVRIGTDPDTIAEGMQLFFRASNSDLRTMGANGRILVEQQFTWSQVAAQMKDVYKWVLGGGDAPASIKQ